MSLLGAIVLSLNPAFYGELESASITFNVTVPVSTPTDAKLYVAGRQINAAGSAPARCGPRSMRVPA